MQAFHIRYSMLNAEHLYWALGNFWFCFIYCMRSKSCPASLAGKQCKPLIFLHYTCVGGCSFMDSFIFGLCPHLILFLQLPTKYLWCRNWSLEKIAEEAFIYWEKTQLCSRSSKILFSYLPMASSCTYRATSTLLGVHWQAYMKRIAWITFEKYPCNIYTCIIAEMAVVPYLFLHSFVHKKASLHTVFQHLLYGPGQNSILFLLLLFSEVRLLFNLHLSRRGQERCDINIYSIERWMNTV